MIFVGSQVLGTSDVNEVFDLLKKYIKKFKLESSLTTKGYPPLKSWSKWIEERISMDFTVDDGSEDEDGSGKENEKGDGLEAFTGIAFGSGLLEDSVELIQSHLQSKFGFTRSCFHLEITESDKTEMQLFIVLGFDCSGMSLVDLKDMADIQVHMKKLPELFKYMKMTYDEKYTLDSTFCYE